MHYLNDRGVWTEAKPLFELFPGGAIARQVQTQVILAPNANTPAPLRTFKPSTSARNSRG